MAQEIGLREVLTQVNARVDGLERRMDRLEQALDGLRREQVANFRWTVGILLGLLVPMWISVMMTVLFRT